MLYLLLKYNNKSANSVLNATSIIGNLSDEQQGQAMDFLKTASKVLFDEAMTQELTGESMDVRRALSLKRLKNKNSHIKDTSSNGDSEEEVREKT